MIDDPASNRTALHMAGPPVVSTPVEPLLDIDPEVIRLAIRAVVGAVIFLVGWWVVLWMVPGSEEVVGGR